MFDSKIFILCRDTKHSTHQKRFELRKGREKVRFVSINQAALINYQTKLTFVLKPRLETLKRSDGTEDKKETSKFTTNRLEMSWRVFQEKALKSFNLLQSSIR